MFCGFSEVALKGSAEEGGCIARSCLGKAKSLLVRTDEDFNHSDFWCSGRLGVGHFAARAVKIVIKRRSQTSFGVPSVNYSGLAVRVVLKLISKMFPKY